MQELDYEKYALPILNDDLNIAGYIMKPVSEELLISALEKYEVKHKEKNTVLYP